MGIVRVWSSRSEIDVEDRGSGRVDTLESAAKHIASHFGSSINLCKDCIKGVNSLP